MSIIDMIDSIIKMQTIYLNDGKEINVQMQVDGINVEVVQDGQVIEESFEHYTEMEEADIDT